MGKFLLVMMPVMVVVVVTYRGRGGSCAGILGLLAFIQLSPHAMAPEARQ